MLRLRAGTATLLIGPRSSAGALGGRYCLDSETDIRQRLTQSLQDPASREAIRRFWGHWQSDLRLAGVKDQSIVDRIAHMGVRGPLIVFPVTDISVNRRDTSASRTRQVAEALQSQRQFKPWSGPVRPPALVSVSAVTPAATRTPAPVDRSIITPPGKMVGDWTIAEKLAAIVVRTADSRKLPLETRELLKKKLTDSKFVAWLIGSLLVWFVSQAFLVGEFFDMLLAGAALVLSGAGIFFALQSLVGAAHLVGQFVDVTRNATEEQELDSAADILADIITTVGLPALLAALTHATTRATSEGKPASTVRMAPPASSSPPPRFAPRPSSATSSEFLNESAQANTLVTAAQNGTPFCEVCSV
jgi:Na+-transporting methylmalonyl-CoA/oxaloacetate decarboxylase gamma subunit